MNIGNFNEFERILDIEILVNLDEFGWCLHMKTGELPEDYIVWVNWFCLYQIGLV